MNLDQILKNILITADYPIERQDEFIKTFYSYLFTKIFNEIENDNSNLAKKILESVQKDANPDYLKQIWEEIDQYPKLKGKVDQVAEQVIKELADDIATSATESQKQQILASLPA